ncbi:MAG: BlaI/MecI/CopY family transcriptional regulator [Planctomycetota bacterium]|jgi:predicted transcriptional regulator
MARRPSIHPTDAELEILQVLWDSGPTALGMIHKALSKQRVVAKTTVATILNIMLEKKLVERNDGARGYLWSAAISRTDTAAGMMGKLIDRVFDGSAQRMVTHLVEGGRLSERELDEIGRLIKQHRGSKKRKRW